MFLSLWKTSKFDQIWALVLKIGHLYECQSTHRMENATRQNIACAYFLSVLLHTEENRGKQQV